MSTKIIETKWKIQVRTDWGNVYEDEIIQARYETDEQFMKRAQVAIEELRRKAST